MSLQDFRYSGFQAVGVSSFFDEGSSVPERWLIHMFSQKRMYHHRQRRYACLHPFKDLEAIAERHLKVQDQQVRWVAYIEHHEHFFAVARNMCPVTGFSELASQELPYVAISISYEYSEGPIHGCHTFNHPNRGICL